MISLTISNSLYRIIKSPYKSNKKGNTYKTFYFGKELKLKLFENYRKENKVSFSDIMMTTSFSRAIKEKIKDNEEYKNKKI